MVIYSLENRGFLILLGLATFSYNKIPNHIHTCIVQSGKVSMRWKKNYNTWTKHLNKKE